MKKVARGSTVSTVLSKVEMVKPGHQIPDSMEAREETWETAGQKHN